jgi:hypothetical protein
MYRLFVQIVLLTCLSIRLNAPWINGWFFGDEGLFIKLTIFVPNIFERSDTSYSGAP